jgi:hypothetical protein
MAALSIGDWAINGNGFQGKLVIKQIDTQGNLVNSTAFGNKIVGFWDEASRKITFVRAVTPTDPASFQVYTGYLMSDNKMVAGYFEAFQGTGGSAKQSVFGWFAKFP